MSNSLIKTPFFPSRASENKNSIFFIYNGTSMSPLFRPGDLLYVQIAVLESIRLGDVIVLNWGIDKDHANYVVHRVVSIKQNHLISQGDNNFKLDAPKVNAENFIGQVVSFSRLNHIYVISGGIKGLLYARFVHLKNYIWIILKRFGRRTYNYIRQSEIISKIWTPCIRQICVMTDQGPLIKYYYGNQTVARWWTERKTFYAIKPFDLVIRNPEEYK